LGLALLYITQDSLIRNLENGRHGIQFLYQWKIQVMRKESKVPIDTAKIKSYDSSTGEQALIDFCYGGWTRHQEE